MLIKALAFAALFFVGAEARAESGPTWSQAEVVERPEVDPPLGGWLIEPGLHANVYGSAEDAATVRTLSNHAARRIPELTKRLGVRPAGTMDIYLMPDQDSFQRLQPGAPPDWADGTAWPRLSLVFLRSPSIRPAASDPLLQVLDHEIVHVLVGQAFGSRPVPRWLQEGLAQFYAGEGGFENGLAFARGDLGSTTISITQLTNGFPRDALGARLAYAQSSDFISWIVAQRGEAALRDLIGVMAAGGDAEAGVRAATGLSLQEADAAWRAHLPSSNVWWPIVTNPTVWGVAGASLLAFGAWRRTQAGRRKLARWEADEALELQRRFERMERMERMAQDEAASAHPAGVRPVAWTHPSAPWVH